MAASLIIIVSCNFGAHSIIVLALFFSGCLVKIEQGRAIYWMMGGWLVHGQSVM
jgi:hypothetical protein